MYSILYCIIIIRNDSCFYLFLGTGFNYRSGLMFRARLQRLDDQTVMPREASDGAMKGLKMSEVKVVIAVIA